MEINRYNTLKMLIEARKYSALSPDMRIVVCAAKEDGYPSAYFDNADGDHVSDSVIDGADLIVCEFNCKRQEPSEEIYLKKLLSYTGLADGDQVKLHQKWTDEELGIEEIERMVSKNERD